MATLQRDAELPSIQGNRPRHQRLAGGRYRRTRCHHGYRLDSHRRAGGCRSDQTSRFFSGDEVPIGTYKNVAGVKTVSVNAIWAISKQPDDLIYNVTSALWNDNTRKLLDSGDAKGRAIRLETAVRGACISLHIGAENFYRKYGVTK